MGYLLDPATGSALSMASMHASAALRLCGLREIDREGIERLAGDECTGVAVLHLLRQLGDGFANDRMDPVRHELRRRRQGECAFVEPGVRHHQFRAAPNKIPRHQEIEVEDSRTPTVFAFAIPTRFSLELVTPPKKIERVTRPPKKNRGVAELGLIGAHRPRPPQPGHPEDLAHVGKSVHRRGKTDRWGAQIRTETDEHIKHGCA